MSKALESRHGEEQKDPTKVHCITVKEQPPIAAQETASLENEDEE